GVPSERAEALRALIAADPDASASVELVDSGDQYEISVNENNDLMLRGPENRTRIEYDSDAAVPRNLWQHARQRALLMLRGEGGSDFRDQETLQVQIVPAPTQLPCADGVLENAGPLDEQLIPLCHSWQIKVRLDESSPHSLAVGGVVLAGDGGTFGIPNDGQAEVLDPGQELTFRAQADTFTAVPPLGIQEQVLVFGTLETNPVPWNLMTEAASRRGGLDSPLARALSNYLSPGTRGAERTRYLVEDTTWTVSTVSYRVVANERFNEPDADSDVPGLREYTLRNFDIRPYLPDDRETAIYAVLRQADWLAGASRREGFSYKQHDWSKPNDEENLAEGIDCSRAIWFAFTRSGLEYNRNNDYLATAQMVADDTLMADQFDRCPANEELQLGDILVYRSDARNDGHVVMVIDAEQRVAWGSHGWDGNANESDYAIHP
ncbi:MAG: caspase family protein, partial [Woeseiaceae bacterium]